MDSLQCRFCLDEDQRLNLISPCSCKGSAKYVHRECLDSWRTSSNNPRNISTCPTCQFKYQTKRRSASVPTWSNYFNYFGNILWVLLKYFCLSQLIIFAAVVSLYLFEVSTNVGELYPLGVVAFLLIIGIYATIINFDNIQFPMADLFRDCDGKGCDKNLLMFCLVLIGIIFVVTGFITVIQMLYSFIRDTIIKQFYLIGRSALDQYDEIVDLG